MKIPFQWCITLIGSIWKLFAKKNNFPKKTVKILLNLIKWNDKALIQRRICRPWPLFIYMCHICLCSSGSQLSIDTSLVGLNILPTVVKVSFPKMNPVKLKSQKNYIFSVFYILWHILHLKIYIKKFPHKHEVKTVLEVPESCMSVNN